ncbi:hypothetical protein CPB85DRAFT_998242 [Mucidula mucida]|nr:hypothetical protein CPB85DRAFT_998242 [Mucidula mucida]
MMSYLPPTINDLAPSQRTRLVRSTRKIQAVLGTTPKFVEPTIPMHKNPRKLALTLAPHPTHPNRPLVLTLTDAPPSHSHSRTISSTDHLHISSSSHSRSRSNSGGPLSPLSPTHTRRKRMAKLTRTLGENIPPELVSVTYEPRRSLPERKSIPDFNPPSESELSDETFVDTLAPLPESKIITHPLTPVSSLPTPQPEPVTPAAPTRSASLHTSRRPKHMRSETGWGHRRELGWSGEWNDSDREEIMKRLRGLKA